MALSLGFGLGERAANFLLFDGNTTDHLEHATLMSVGASPALAVVNNVYWSCRSAELSFSSFALSCVAAFGLGTSQLTKKPWWRRLKPWSRRSGLDERRRLRRHYGQVKTAVLVVFAETVSCRQCLRCCTPAKSPRRDALREGAYTVRTCTVRPVAHMQSCSLSMASGRIQHPAHSCRSVFSSLELLADTRRTVHVGSALLP